MTTTITTITTTNVMEMTRTSLTLVKSVVKSNPMSVDTVMPLPMVVVSMIEMVNIRGCIKHKGATVDAVNIILLLIVGNTTIEGLPSDNLVCTGALRTEILTKEEGHKGVHRALGGGIMGVGVGLILKTMLGVITATILVGIIMGAWKIVGIKS